MDISVIIPIYNAQKPIRECLLSVLNSDFSGELEVIAVNDGSIDASAERIKDLPVKIINQKNQGSASARNIGAKAAQSPIIIFVDADVEFFQDTLKRMYEHLIKQDVDYLSVRYAKRSINQKWINKYKGLADYCYYYDFIRPKKDKGGLMRQVMLSGGTEGVVHMTTDSCGKDHAVP